MTKRTTMLDIARLAGVSKATVSRAIHRPDLVKPETRQRIHGIIEATDYIYDAVAGDLSKRKTSVIGLIIPTIKSSIFAESTHGIQEKAQTEGFSVIIGNTNYAQELEFNLLRLFQQRRVAGLILTGIEPEVLQLVKDFPKQGVPYVVTWQKLDEQDINFVGFDNFSAAFAITKHLLSLKHRRIGIITGHYSKISRVMQRLEGYRAAMVSHGSSYDPQLVIEKDYSLIDGKEAMHRLLSMPSPPTAVFAASDVLAMGALAAVRERGLKVPDNISLVGFDDIDFAAYCDPPLTTVRVPAYEMGQLAVKILLEIIRGFTQGVQQYCLDTDLIIRGSCRELGL